MYLLKFFALKTYKTVYYVSNMAVFWIDMSAIIYAWNFTFMGIIKALSHYCVWEKLMRSVWKLMK
jgi:hypothetical protein